MLISKSVRITIMDVYMGVICVFPIATMLIPGGFLNKTLFGLLLILHMGMLVTNPMKKKSFIGVFILLANYLFVICNTEFPLESNNLLFYFPFFLMYTYFMCDNRLAITKWFRHRERFVRFIIWTWTVLVGVSIFVPSCYKPKEGGSLYFGSFCGSIFRLGPSAMFIQVLGIISMVFYKRKKDIIYQFVPLYCAFMGSSRTYLVVCVLIFVVAWYIACPRRRTFWATMIPLSVVIILLVAKTAIGDKIEHTLDDSQYGDFWFRVTSGRSEFWGKDLVGWADSPFINKLLGNGLGFTLDLTGLWAHNDFIEILCSFGILGLIHYIYAVVHMLRVGYGRVRIPFVVSLCVCMCWLFNAFFNMHYVYFCAMLCFPFLVFVVREHTVQQQEAERKRRLRAQREK